MYVFICKVSTLCFQYILVSEIFHKVLIFFLTLSLVATSAVSDRVQPRSTGNVPEDFYGS